MAGVITAAALTLGAGYVLATGMHVGKAMEKISSEFFILQPPEPPPPVKEPEKPKIKIEKPAEAPPPELVAPPIEITPPEPPVITAPVAESPPAPPAPVVAATPSPGSDRVLPKLRAGDKPEYPASARRAGEQGTTRLDVCVSTAGRVTSVAVASSSGSPRLDQAAAQWIKGERFEPGKIGGVAQDMCGHQVYYQWSLKDAA